MCMPAQVYLAISAVSILAAIIQNAGNDSTLCIGEFECEVSHVGHIFIAQGLYAAFWTFVLASICKAGHRNIAWFLVLIPFILGAIILALFMMTRPGYKRQAPIGAYMP